MITVQNVNAFNNPVPLLLEYLTVYLATVSAMVITGFILLVPIFITTLIKVVLHKVRHNKEK